MHHKFDTKFSVNSISDFRFQFIVQHVDSNEAYLNSFHLVSVKKENSMTANHTPTENSTSQSKSKTVKENG